MKQLVDRFEEKVIVDEDTSCHLWAGSRDRYGYGRIGVDGTNTPAHRVSYGLYVGRIPVKFDIDHLCRNPACVNPEHLEAVSRKVNVQRGKLGDLHTPRDVCPEKHALEGNNLGVSTQGWRYCKECKRLRARAFYREKTN